MSPLLSRALLGGLTVLLGLYTAHLALGVGTTGLASRLLEDWLYNALIVVTGLVCASRALVRDSERLAWLLLGAAITVWGLGNAYWSLLLADQNQFPSAADAMWLLFYVLAYASLAMIFRSRVPRASLNVGIDGVIVALAVTTVVAAVVFDAVLGATEGSRIAIAVNLAYPVGDALLLALVVAAVALSGWRVTGTWLFAAAGAVVFGITDGMYVYQVAVGTYDELSLMNAGWPAGCLLLAYAAWRPRESLRARAEDWSSVAVSIGSAGLAVAVLVYDHFHRVSVLTLILASATLAAVLLRLALTFREQRRLVAANLLDAHTDSITGLGNRRALLRHIEAGLAETGEERRLVVVLLDLNGFKEYNDSFGHLAGDALLARLGARLAAAMPEGGHAFRMGGDEFCAVVEETSALAAARIGAIAGAALSDHGEGFDIDSAWGHVVAPDEADTATEILKLADRRMYAAKAARSSIGRQSARLLVRALEEREPSLAEHISEVVGLAEEIGTRVGLAPERLEQVRRAAELHDVGKMAIPDAILLKTGPLDDDEWVFVRRHTLTGEWILSAAPALASVAKLVRSSHERWDGTGYPDGLAGEQIPLESRIVAIADAYAAMLSDRPYRAALSHTDAIDELRANSGTQFDPDLVETAVEILAARDRRLRSVAAA